MTISKKALIISTIITITILISATFLIKSRNTFKLLYINLDVGAITQIEDFIKEENPKIIIKGYVIDGRELSIEQINEEFKDIDVMFTNNYHNLIKYKDKLKTINAPLVKQLPSSISNLSYVDKQLKMVPVQLDHVELALLNSTYKALYSEKNSKISLIELESHLEGLKSETFFPLVVAGKSDSDLMNIISLLTVSVTGADGYTRLTSSIGDEKQTFNDLLEIPLNNSSNLKSILDRLIDWRRKGILHSEWLQFDNKAVKSFAEDGLTASMIMPLSEHRTYTLNIIKNFTAVQFPMNNNKSYAPDILISPLFAVAMKGSTFKTDNIINSFIDSDFQKTFTYYTGMAPVNSTTPALDMQASDVRFWSAASNKIAVAVPDDLIKTDRYKTFLENCRNYLISNSY